MAQGTDEQLQADVRNDQSKNPIIILQKKRGSSVVEKQNASKLTPANNLEGSISIGGAPAFRNIIAYILIVSNQISVFLSLWAKTNHRRQSWYS